MRTIETVVYNFDELDDKAKEVAREWYREGNTDVLDAMFPAHMANMAKEYMDVEGITYDADSINVLYSLGYCQGDGAMFEGKVTWKGHNITIKHAGNYAHYNSKIIDCDTFQGEECALFNAIYVGICRKLEDLGYTEIEYRNSNECVDQEIEANEYTFTKDGKRFG